MASLGTPLSRSAPPSDLQTAQSSRPPVTDLKNTLDAKRLAQIVVECTNDAGSSLEMCLANVQLDYKEYVTCIMTFCAMRAPVAACGAGGVPVASSIGTPVLLLEGCESPPPAAPGGRTPGNRAPRRQKNLAQSCRHGRRSPVHPPATVSQCRTMNSTSLNSPPVFALAGGVLLITGVVLGNIGRFPGKGEQSSQVPAAATRHQNLAAATDHSAEQSDRTHPLRDSPEGKDRVSTPPGDEETAADDAKWTRALQRLGFAPGAASIPTGAIPMALSLEWTTAARILTATGTSCVASVNSPYCRVEVLPGLTLGTSSGWNGLEVILWTAGAPRELQDGPDPGQLPQDR